MSDDRQLLRRFADDRSEAAFGELVAHHVALVYSAALRQTGDAHLAQDIAQLVFSDLARKARTLSENVVLAGWLHRATIFAARQTIRSERRRRAREQEAVTMNSIQSETENDDWQQIRPLLDEALERLNKTDRDALLLRFFEQQSLAQVGATLGGSEDAARKRINRALEKLRAILTRNGVTTTATALSTVISANAVQAAPTGLAAMLTNSSFSGAGTGINYGGLNMMSMNRFKLAVSALVVTGVATFLVMQQHGQFKLHAENESFTQPAAQQPLPQQQAISPALSNDPAATGVAGLPANVASNQQPDLQDGVEVLSDNGTNAGKSGVADPQLQTPQHGGRAVWELHVVNQGSHACIKYALDHQLQFPTSLDQVAPYLTSDVNIEEVESNCVIVFQGSMADIAYPGRTVVVMGNDSWQGLKGNWMKAYGFANGKGAVYMREQNDFDVFESRHTIPPPSNP